MSVLDGGLFRSHVIEMFTQRCSLGFRHRLHHNTSLICYAKLKVSDEEQKPHTSGKGFSIIPKLGDIESARRLLETAFQALSFEMPKLPINSALHGISKLSIPKQVLVFDITGFVASKMRRPQKELEDLTPNGRHYPRCAWPRTSKGVHWGEDPLSCISGLETVQDKEDVVLEQSQVVYPHSKWPRTIVRSRKADLLNGAVVGQTPGPTVGLKDDVSFENLIGPHCAWPQDAQQVPQNVAWPMRSLSGNGMDLRGSQPVVDSMKDLAFNKVSTSIDQGGPRCAWPRKTIPAKQSFYADNSSASPELEQGKCTDSGVNPCADSDGRTALPRRMLATSVGLAVMNQLAKGSFIVTPLIYLGGLLPGGSLDITEEEEDAALDVGRRALLVLIKSSCD